MQQSAPMHPARPRHTLAALLRVALYYGVAGFGGGYSVLAQLRRDMVEKRRWLTDEEFLVLAELSKSLPGTPATSLMALVGQRVGGVRGGVLAAGAFLVPSILLMMLLGAHYALIRNSTGLAVFFDGMNAAMVGVVAAVTLDLGRVALHTRRAAAIAIACALALAVHVVSEPILAAAAITVGGGVGWRRLRSAAAAAAPKDEAAAATDRVRSLFPFPLLLATLGTLGTLVQVFVPIGVMTFGGGLAMIPAIGRIVVDQQHWMGPKGFADAIALGQITPGPIAICATLIGYRVDGIAGALVATAAMFGPAIALAVAVGRSVDRFHGNPIVAGALKALAPIVIAMLLAATWSLGRAGVEGPLGIAVAVATFALLARVPSVSPLWPLVGGGLLQTIAVRVFHAG